MCTIQQAVANPERGAIVLVLANEEVHTGENVDEGGMI